MATSKVDSELPSKALHHGGHKKTTGDGSGPRASFLKRRESFRQKESMKTSFEGSFFMDFYFSQGDYKLEASKTAKEVHKARNLTTKDFGNENSCKAKVSQRRCKGKGETLKNGQD